ncbi:MAG: lipopolysaccharide biosynthesis protein, partial [Armatimonadota bacterium]
MVEQVLRQVRTGAHKLVHTTLYRPFVRHVGVLTVANGVGAVLSFVQGILVARWLGPELYGVAALVMSIPSLVYTFFDARSAEASVKFLSEFDARGERER